jgi:hypothetical protein
MNSSHSKSSGDLISLLESKDQAIVIKALHQMEKAANINDLPAIIRVMATWKGEKIMNDFAYFLSNVRSKQAPAVMVGFLSDPLFANIRTELTRACWESQLDYSQHLLIFARLFISGEFGLALEAFSVIENTCLERPVPKGIMKEVFTLIGNSLCDQPEPKQRLTHELISVMEPFISEG